MAGEHAGHRQRMRERFREQGLEGFADHEVLELMLFYAIPQRNVNPLAHQLMERFGSLHGVLEASPEELMQVEGIGENAATMLSLYAHAARRLELSRSKEKKRFRTYWELEEHCRRLLGGLTQEHFYVVCLNTQMELIRSVLIARGTLSEVQAYPREVVDAVLRHNAHAVVLCHNHPGGSLIPSQQDVELTRRLTNVLGGIDVDVIDHIVVGSDMALSMVECGLMKRPDPQLPSQNRVADPEGEVRIRHQLEKRLKGLKEE